MHFICHSNINVKRHLIKRSNLHPNDHGLPALVRNSKNFLNNFDSVCLQNILNLFMDDRDSLSSESSESPFSINNEILHIPKQRINNALNTVIDHLNINSMIREYE